MAFTLDRSKTFTWPVTVGVPDGGEVEACTFEAKLLRLPQSQIAKLGKDFADPETPTDEVTLASRLLKGWTGIQNEGEPVAYSEEVKQQVLDIPGVANAVVKAWMEASQESLAKNSGKPPSTGQAK